MKLKALLIGASGHARVVADILSLTGHSVVGALSDRTADPDRFPYPVLGHPADFSSIYHDEAIDCVLVAIGDNATRQALVHRLVDACEAVRFGTAIHPASVIAEGTHVSPGCVVMAGAIVNPGCLIGAHAILNTRCSVDHDCIIAEFSSVAPGAVLGGNVRVGARSAIGIGAAVIHGIEIGADSVIGAGAAVISDVPPNVVAVGVPARILRERNHAEPYL